MGDDGKTIGTYFNADEQDDLLDAFDERFDDGRSAAVKDAMRLHIAVDKAIGATGYEFGSEQEKRHWVRQAILDLYRQEQADDD